VTRRIPRAWTAAAVLTVVLNGPGCGGGGPEPGMLKASPALPPPVPGMGDMKELRKHPAKMRRRLHEAVHRSKGLR
jgi:hypothetical protein